MTYSSHEVPAITRDVYRAAIEAAVKRCTPLHFSEPWHEPWRAARSLSALSTTVPWATQRIHDDSLDGQLAGGRRRRNVIRRLNRRGALSPPTCAVCRFWCGGGGDVIIFSRVRRSRLGSRRGVTVRFTVAGATSFRCLFLIYFTIPEGGLLVQFFEQSAPEVAEYIAITPDEPRARGGFSGRYSGA